MTKAESNDLPLQTNRVILTLMTETDRSYLRSILEFIDCEVVWAATPRDVKKAAEGAHGQSVSVVMDAGVKAEELNTLLVALGDTDTRPALFQVYRGPQTDLPVIGEVLGSLRLPGQFDAVNGMLHKAQLFNENQLQGEGARRPLELFRSLSGNSRATRRINKMIQQVAGTDATVLVLGESGTGKEVVARKLHYHSKRRGKPFVPVNCGAIPGDLLESELFGHEKGAFTGAITSRQGRFELAEGGTLFLDEIGDMSLSMQVKLLRVLQERTFERVGSNKTVRCNVRIIAATHRDLEAMIRDSQFREDLFYRLNVFPIEMPPLRERVEDIPVLVNDLITRIEHEKRGSVRLTPAAITALQHCHWAGNVRELANLIERLGILYPYGVIDVGDLPEKFRSHVKLPESGTPGEGEEGDAEEGVASLAASAATLPNDGLDLKAHLAEMELGLIKQALEDADGVVAHAAKRLKMRRTTLVEKLRKYGLQRGSEMTDV